MARSIPRRAPATPLPGRACNPSGFAYAWPMPLWKRLGFLFVFLVPALMPAAAWLGARSGYPDLMAWFPL